MRSPKLSVISVAALLLAVACQGDRTTPRAATAPSAARALPAASAPHPRAPLASPGHDCAAAAGYAQALAALDALPDARDGLRRARGDLLEQAASWAGAPAELRALVAAPAGAHVVELAVAAANCTDGARPDGRVLRYQRLGRFLMLRAIDAAHAGRPAEAAQALAAAVQLGGDVARGGGVLEALMGARLQQRTVALAVALAELGVLDEAGAQLVAGVAERALASAPSVRESLATELAAWEAETPDAGGSRLTALFARAAGRIDPHVACWASIGRGAGVCAAVRGGDRAVEDRLATRTAVAALRARQR